MVPLWWVFVVLGYCFVGYIVARAARVKADEPAMIFAAMWAWPVILLAYGLLCVWGWRNRRAGHGGVAEDQGGDS